MLSQSQLSHRRSRAGCTQGDAPPTPPPPPPCATFPPGSPWQQPGAPCERWQKGQPQPVPGPLPWGAGRCPPLANAPWPPRRASWPPALPGTRCLPAPACTRCHRGPRPRPRPGALSTRLRPAPSPGSAKEPSLTPLPASWGGAVWPRRYMGFAGTAMMDLSPVARETEAGSGPRLPSGSRGRAGAPERRLRPPRAGGRSADGSGGGFRHRACAKLLAQGAWDRLWLLRSAPAPWGARGSPEPRWDVSGGHQPVGLSHSWRRGQS